MLKKVLCLVFLMALSSEAFAIGRRAAPGCSNTASSCAAPSAASSFVPANVMPADESPTAIVPDAGTVRVGASYSSTVSVGNGRGGLFHRLAERRAARRGSKGCH